MRRQKFVVASATALALVACTAAPSLATVLLPKSLEEIVHEADVIVVGRVADDAQALYGPDSDKIFTYTSLDVDSVMKGNLDGTRATIRTIGGEIGAHSLEVPSAPSAGEPGDVVVAFLYGDTDRYMSNVVFWQGLFHVRDGIVVERGIPLSQFVDEVRSILRAGE